MNPSIAITEDEQYDVVVILPNFRVRLIGIGLGLSLATGRWGAWIGLPGEGIFLIDVIVLSGIFLVIICDGIKLDYLTLILGTFLILQLLRNSDYAMITRVRDLLPFIYLQMFLLIRNQLFEIPIIYIYKLLRVASLFSLIWNLGVGLNVIPVLPSNSFFGVPIFSQRPDQAGFVACIGIIVWSLSLTETKFERVMNFWILPLNLLSLLLQPGRAGLLALLVALPLIAARAKKGPKVSRRGLAAFIVATVMVVPFAGVVQSFLPEKSAIKKFGILDQSGAALSSGDSTAYGRKMGQTTLLKWTMQEGKLLNGAGPGYEMLAESGAVRWLSGNADVRYPHNWWVSLISRFGIVGFACWLMCGLASLKGVRRENVGFQFLTFLISILAASTFGVVMESPFGIIPFAFFTARLVK
jgi:hypothetical protein